MRLKIVFIEYFVLFFVCICLKMCAFEGMD